MKTCINSNCGKKTHSLTRGLCKPCYSRARYLGMLDECSLPATSNAREMWSVVPTSEGYNTIKTPDGIIGEHRHVMQQMIGRQLLPSESVHHINGVRDDNRPENLELWVSAHPSGQRITELVEYMVQHHRERLIDALA